ncbi:related to heat shock protein Hsp30-like [Phialocephala subalpina]|uniref:Related to heat shock protein Hsp30-like n=1 Tax=Phialocephala subalpina TaxID=576137 RepID=A0A1L7XR79_9HELO|nr:related to heat shock protein Hsp30-like [Phialocephala subalpina]
MPFFQPAYLSPEADFFQLLSALDQPTHKAACRPQRRAETFNPRFDVTESADSYDLYGELPGLTQDDLTIEFSDAQTLVVKGKTQRALNTPSAQPEQTTSEKGKEREVDTSSEKSHAPTVEDDYDDVDAPVATPATSTTATPEEQQPQQAAETAAPKPKFWVAERKVGEFARSFSFSQRIEQDFVSADLSNGVLHVTVPKSQKPRKVTVTVN